MEATRQVAMGAVFYPRGGSAQVIRYLSPPLAAKGWPVSLLCGSLGHPGERTHAPTFFAGLDLTAVDYNPALEAYRAGRDPLAEPVPFHPSFEDHADVPDRVFASISPEVAEHLVGAWERLGSGRWSEAASIFHLHHLTPLHEAVKRRWPERPVVTSIHGTETKMLDRIGRLTAIAETFGTDLPGMADLAEAGALGAPSSLDPAARTMLDETRWSHWRFGHHWERRLRAVANSSDRIIVSSPHERGEVERLLGLGGERVEEIPNGVDTQRFDRRELDAEAQLQLWRHWLIEDPRGWDESGQPGTIRYREDDLRAFRDPQTGNHRPVLLFVGRFLEVKRVELLLRAYARARSRLEIPAPLVIWGGFPGEWEGAHPHRVAQEVGVDKVFFTGWRDHDELPDGLACADVFVAPSIKEGFGQVFIEAMACGLPVIAARSGGPMSFVNTEPGRPNGWLAEPDDIATLTDALVEAVNDPGARRRRADNAYEQARASYSWDRLAARFVGVYESVLS
jgi:D-inositol-3-phosphate glycosyltransferase